MSRATFAIPALVLSGTSGGVPIRPVSVWGVGTLTVDTTAQDAADTFTVFGAANAHGVGGLTVLTGGGADTMTVRGPATFTGDLLFHGLTPLVFQGSVEGARRSLDWLATFEPQHVVPGHGAPLDRAQFATYRAAFDRLLACAASDAPAATCKVGWRRDAGALVPARDAALADSLLDYYIPHVLRAPPERRSRYCRKEPSK